ncbi:hypothetical protein V7097_18815, partial [Bacillus sp. JJ1562]
MKNYQHSINMYGEQPGLETNRMVPHGPHGPGCTCGQHHAHMAEPGMIGGFNPQGTGVGPMMGGFGPQGSGGGPMMGGFDPQGPFVSPGMMGGFGPQGS